MTFNEELNAATNPWIKRIGNYLLSRDDIQENLKKENKSLKECFDYIIIELSKKAKTEGKVGFAAGDDKELFEMAVHYYDEDDIKLDKKNFTTNADGSADASEFGKKIKKEAATEVIDQEAIDKAVCKALEDYKKEEKEKAKKAKVAAEEAKKAKIAAKEAKKVSTDNEEQLALF